MWNPQCGPRHSNFKHKDPVAFLYRFVQHRDERTIEIALHIMIRSCFLNGKYLESDPPSTRIGPYGSLRVISHQVLFWSWTRQGLPRRRSPMHLEKNSGYWWWFAPYSLAVHTSGTMQRCQYASSGLIRPVQEAVVGDRYSVSPQPWHGGYESMAELWWLGKTDSTIWRLM